MQQPESVPRIPSLFKYFLPTVLLLAAGACLWFFRDHTIKFLSAASGWPLLGIIVISFACFFLDVVRVKFYFSQLRIPINFTKFYHIIMASNVMSQGIQTKLGAPVRSILLKKFVSIDYSLSFTIFIYDTILGYIVIGLGSLVGIHRFYPGFSTRTIVLIILGIALLLALLVGTKIKFFQAGPNEKPSIVSVKENLRSCMDLLSIRVLFIGAALIFIAGILGALRLKIELSCLNYNINVMTLLLIEWLAYSASTLSLIPAGIGVREASQTFLFMQVGVPQDVAITLSLIDRFFTTGLSVLIGFISLGILGHDAGGKLWESRQSDTGL